MRNRDALTVLVTGAGAPGIAGTVYALRQNPDGKPVRVIGADARPDVVGKYIMDEFSVVPRASERSFIPSLLTLARRHSVNVVLPQVTAELAPLAEARIQFEAAGIAVAVSTAESIRRANSKLEVIRAAKALGVPTPRFYTASDRAQLQTAAHALGYPDRPVVVKPLSSSGMRGFRVLTSRPWDMDRFLSERPDGVELRLDELLSILPDGRFPELLVTDYLSGNEYSVDVYRGARASVAIPRIRQEIRSGITFKSLIDRRSDLVDYSILLARSLDLRLAFGFQFKLDDDGTPKILECNPRVQGTMIASALAGFNLIYYAVLESMGIEVSNPMPGDIKNGLRLIRYWGAVAYDGSDTVRI